MTVSGGVGGGDNVALQHSSTWVLSGYSLYWVGAVPIGWLSSLPRPSTRWAVGKVDKYKVFNINPRKIFFLCVIFKLWRYLIYIYIHIYI